MVLQVINIGALPNDGEGDPLRVAFQKVNDNFATLSATSFNVAESTTVGLTPDQTIFEYPVDMFTQGMFQVRSYIPGTADMQNVVISAATTNNQLGVKFSAYATSFDGNALCRYDMDVASANVRLLINPLQDTVIYHYISYQITNPAIVTGPILELDGYPSGFVMITENNVELASEGI